MNLRAFALLTALPVLSLALAVACRGDGGAGTPAPDEPVSGTPGPAGPTVEPGAGLEAARQDLAARLGAPVADVELIGRVPFVWDGCLGVAEPQTACPELGVFGEAVILAVGDQRYVYHVAGSSFVFTQQSATAVVYPPDAAFLAWLSLAARLGVDPAGIELVELRPVTWPDGCLGVYLPETACTEALVPGFILVLRAGGADHTFHLGGGQTFSDLDTVPPGAQIGEPLPEPQAE